MKKYGMIRLAGDFFILESSCIKFVRHFPGNPGPGRESKEDSVCEDGRCPLPLKFARILVECRGSGAFFT